MYRNLIFNMNKGLAILLTFWVENLASREMPGSDVCLLYQWWEWFNKTLSIVV